MFFKFPSQFKIETPICTYNPDWAVCLNKNGEQKLYFVIESTKESLNKRDLRTRERQRIHCGEEHFKALNSGVGMHLAKDWKGFRETI
jgi:type III restriction enzyme